MHWTSALSYSHSPTSTTVNSFHIFYPPSHLTVNNRQHFSFLQPSLPSAVISETLTFLLSTLPVLRVYFSFFFFFLITCSRKKQSYKDSLSLWMSSVSLEGSVVYTAGLFTYINLTVLFNIFRCSSYILNKVLLV